MYWSNGQSNKFAQTFLLAEQPNGYFVLNDVLRILTTTTAAAAAASVSNAKNATETAAVTKKTTVNETYFKASDH